jgi:hypothetical protein
MMLRAMSSHVLFWEKMDGMGIGADLYGAKIGFGEGKKNFMNIY